MKNKECCMSDAPHTSRVIELADRADSARITTTTSRTAMLATAGNTIEPLISKKARDILVHSTWFTRLPFTIFGFLGAAKFVQLTTGDLDAFNSASWSLLLVIAKLLFCTLIATVAYIREVAIMRFGLDPLLKPIPIPQAGENSATAYLLYNDWENQRCCSWGKFRLMLAILNFILTSTGSIGIFWLAGLSALPVTPVYISLFLVGLLNYAVEFFPFINFVYGLKTIFDTFVTAAANCVGDKTFLWGNEHSKYQLKAKYALSAFLTVFFLFTFGLPVFQLSRSGVAVGLSVAPFLEPIAVTFANISAATFAFMIGILTGNAIVTFPRSSDELLSRNMLFATLSAIPNLYVVYFIWVASAAPQEDYAGIDKDALNITGMTLMLFSFFMITSRTMYAFFEAHKKTNGATDDLSPTPTSATAIAPTLSITSVAGNESPTSGDGSPTATGDDTGVGAGTGVVLAAAPPPANTDGTVDCAA